jgi:hypothetical protein
MSFTSDLLETPPNLSVASKWTAMNGYIYLSLGALYLLFGQAQCRPSLGMTNSRDTRRRSSA